jgi:hypothetical protein
MLTTGTCSLSNIKLNFNHTLSVFKVKNFSQYYPHPEAVSSIQSTVTCHVMVSRELLNNHHHNYNNFDFRLEQRAQNVGFEVLIVVVVKSSIIWDKTPCSPLKVNQCFRGTSCLHLQSSRV